MRHRHFLKNYNIFAMHSFMLKNELSPYLVYYYKHTRDVATIGLYNYCLRSTIVTFFAYSCVCVWNYNCIDCEQFFLLKLTACIEVLIENNTLVKFKQNMLQYTSLYMINNSLCDLYTDKQISV